MTQPASTRPPGSKRLFSHIVCENCWLLQKIHQFSMLFRIRFFSIFYYMLDHYFLDITPISLINELIKIKVTDSRTKIIWHGINALGGSGWQVEKSPHKITLLRRNFMRGFFFFIKDLIFHLIIDFRRFRFFVLV